MDGSDLIAAQHPVVERDRYLIASQNETKSRN